MLDVEEDDPPTVAQVTESTFDKVLAALERMPATVAALVNQPTPAPMPQDTLRVNPQAVTPNPQDRIQPEVKSPSPNRSNWRNLNNDRDTNGCWNCGSLQHWSRECPNKTLGNANRPQ